MIAIELLEKYPEAATVINEFYRSKMIESLNTEDVPDEFKELIKQQEFDNQYIAKFIDGNPRILFDVFDANNIYIQISVDLENNCFRYSFDGGRVESNDYELRISAEKAAIESAFQILNEKLCQTK
jgi:hypothetical protein